MNLKIFTTAPTTSAGDAPIGSIIGPNSYTWHLSLRKSFKLPKESMNLMFQADLFNVFNRANFVLGGLGNATLTAGSGNFGAVGGAVNPRNVQFGFKFNF